MKRKQPFSYEEFKDIYSKVPRLCVDLIIQDEKGNFVLLKRGMEPYKGYWEIPGGTVLFRESIDQAIERIAKEEVGLKVKVEGLVGFIEFLEEERGNRPFHSLSLAVVCTPEKLRTSESYSIFNQIPDETIPEQAKFLERYLKGLCEDDACHDPNCEEDHS